MLTIRRVAESLVQERLDSGKAMRVGKLQALINVDTEEFPHMVSTAATPQPADTAANLPLNDRFILIGALAVVICCSGRSLLR